MRRDTIGDRVASAIHRSRKKLEKVAEEANVTAAWLSALKNDRITNPPPDKIRALARATGHPLSYFAEALGWTDGDENADWLAGLRADDRLDDDGKALIERLIRLEMEASERREAPAPSTKEPPRRRAV